MRTFNVGLLAVLSCVAMIGAVPSSTYDPVPSGGAEARALKNRSPVEAVEAPATEYVALQQLMEVLTRLKSFLQSFNLSRGGSRGDLHYVRDCTT